MKIKRCILTILTYVISVGLGACGTSSHLDRLASRNSETAEITEADTGSIANETAENGGSELEPEDTDTDTDTVTVELSGTLEQSSDLPAGQAEQKTDDTSMDYENAILQEEGSIGTGSTYQEVEERLKGLWIRCNSTGSLYYFEDGKAVNYIREEPYSPEAPDVNYVEQETTKYEIEPLSPDEGDGYRIIMSDSLEYRLFDEYPDILSCYFLDQGELIYSGSGSYERAEDLSLDDVISVRHMDSPADGLTEHVEESPYIDVVRQYEAEYGKLEYEVSEDLISYYRGVFLLKLLDFDQDGTQELIIGYAEEVPDAIVSVPSLDVWTLKDEIPVQVYEKATVAHGDVARHCGFTDWGGRYCLIDGITGYVINLSLYAFENGSFHECFNVRNGLDEPRDEELWTVNGEVVSSEDGYEALRLMQDTPDLYCGFPDNVIESRSVAEIYEQLNESYRLLGYQEQ